MGVLVFIWENKPFPANRVQVPNIQLFSLLKMQDTVKKQKQKYSNMYNFLFFFQVFYV